MTALVNLSKLPQPNFIETVAFETLLTNRKQAFIALFEEKDKPYWQEKLQYESEPIIKLLEENCYLEMLLRQRINQAANATTLAHATGNDLDVVAANFNVKRQCIQPADNTQTPPKAAIYEPDDRLRLRAQQAFEGLSVAGPRAAYQFHTLSSHPDITDVHVESYKPAHVTVTILSRLNDGHASQSLIDIVTRYLNDENIRPIADRVTVQGATIKNYIIHVRLFSYLGPESEPIRQAAENNLLKYIHEQRRLGRSIYLSAIHAALHVEGVQRVEIITPVNDLILQPYESANCIDYKIEVTRE